jgi:hypothetical protein
MTFNEFLDKNEIAINIEDRAQNWAHPFDDWKQSLRIAFAVLIYCAENGLKISYAGLGRISNIPRQYTSTGRQALGTVAGYMLEVIGRYCQELKDKPKLTSLCVSYVSGFPGGGYYTVFDPETMDNTLEQQKEILLKLFKTLKDYDWSDVKKELKELGVKIEDISESIKNEAFNQNRFYIPGKQNNTAIDDIAEDIINDDVVGNVVEDKTEQTIKNDKYKFTDETKKSGRCLSVVLLLLVVVLCIYIFTSKDKESSMQWFFTLSIPVSFALWNIDKLLKIFMRTLIDYKKGSEDSDKK